MGKPYGDLWSLYEKCTFWFIFCIHCSTLTSNMTQQQFITWNRCETYFIKIGHLNRTVFSSGSWPEQRWRALVTSHTFTERRESEYDREVAYFLPLHHVPSSSSLALTVRMAKPTSASSSTSTSYTVWAKTGLLSFTSLMKTLTYAVSEGRRERAQSERLNARPALILSTWTYPLPLSLSLLYPSTSPSILLSSSSVIPHISPSCSPSLSVWLFSFWSNP